MRTYHYWAADATGAQPLPRRQIARTNLWSRDPAGPETTRFLTRATWVRKWISPDVYQFSRTWPQESISIHHHGFGGYAQNSCFRTSEARGTRAREART